MNTIVITGNLTKDITLRYNKDGVPFGTSSIAINEFKLKDKTNFIDIIAFNRTAEVMNEYLRKGSKVLIRGRIDLQHWVNKEGEKRQKHQIIVEDMEMIGKPLKEFDKSTTKSTEYTEYKKPNVDIHNQLFAGNYIADEEIPF